MFENEKIKVMVVNDSLLMRIHLSELIMSSSHLIVGDTARDGVEALAKIKRNKPDVILTDLEMPNMDGFTFIQNLAKDDTLIPIIVVSSYGHESAKLVFDSLEVGALDFVTLPIKEENLPQFKEILIQKIEIAARSNPSLLIPQKILNIKPVKKIKEKAGTASKVVIIGASTGGPRVLYELFSNLPSDLNAGVLIIQHMPPGFTNKFAQRLDGISRLKITEARDGDPILEGTCMVAPGDYHMLVEPSHCVVLNQSQKRFGVRPAINMSMITAAETYGPNTIGVLLTGMGQDGAFGMKMIKKRGGYTIAQDETTSVVYGMAKAAKELESVDKMLPINKISDEIVRLVNA